jgi:hypothetical protein
MNGQQALAWAANRRWFYQFQLPNGSLTTVDVGPDVLLLHQNRLDMMLSVLANRFGNRLSRCTGLDIASHEGFFSLALARVMKSVRGIDVNAQSVEAAQVMAGIQGAINVEFAVCDIRNVDITEFPPADFVLLYGLLYHAEDPIRMLRIASALATDTLLIETQVTGLELEGDVEWGTYRASKKILGTFYLVDDQVGREGGNTLLAMIPSLSAIQSVLLRLGFRSVDVVAPPPDGAEQLVRRKRAVIAAHR